MQTVSHHLTAVPFVLARHKNAESIYALLCFAARWNNWQRLASNAQSPRVRTLNRFSLSRSSLLIIEKIYDSPRSSGQVCRLFLLQNLTVATLPAFDRVEESFQGIDSHHSVFGINVITRLQYCFLLGVLRVQDPPLDIQINDLLGQLSQLPCRAFRL